MQLYTCMYSNKNYTDNCTLVVTYLNHIYIIIGNAALPSNQIHGESALALAAALVHIARRLVEVPHKA